MELFQLRYFLTVAEEGSFTRAATRLRVAQPGVSTQIRKLENELRQPLFDRSNRTVQLTELGRRVVPFARTALSAAAEMRNAADALSGEMNGQVRIGMPISYHSAALPKMLAQFHSEHPAVEILLSESDSNDLVAALVAGELDLALISANRVPPQVELLQIDDEPLVAGVSSDSTLATQASVTVARLASYTLISPPQGTGIRMLLDTTFESMNISPHIALETRDLRVLAHLASGGLGVAVLPKSIADVSGDSLRSVSIVGPALRAQVSLAWTRGTGRSPAARALIQSARKSLGA